MVVSALFVGSDLLVLTDFPVGEDDAAIRPPICHNGANVRRFLSRISRHNKRAKRALGNSGHNSRVRLALDTPDSRPRAGLTLDTPGHRPRDLSSTLSTKFARFTLNTPGDHSRARETQPRRDENGGDSGTLLGSVLPRRVLSRN